MRMATAGVCIIGLTALAVFGAIIAGIKWLISSDRNETNIVEGKLIYAVKGKVF